MGESTLLALAVCTLLAAAGTVLHAVVASPRRAREQASEALQAVEDIRAEWRTARAAIHAELEQLDAAKEMAERKRKSAAAAASRAASVQAGGNAEADTDWERRVRAQWEV